MKHLLKYYCRWTKSRLGMDCKCSIMQCIASLVGLLLQKKCPKQLKYFGHKIIFFIFLTNHREKPHYTFVYESYGIP